MRLDIRLSGDRSGRAPYPVSAKSRLGSFTLDSTGRVLGAGVRGTVHWLPGRDEAARALLLAQPGVRGRLPVVIPGTDVVACASDSGGEDGLDVIPADGSAARRIGHGEFGRILELAVAPDGRLAAVACADGRLLTVALDGEPVITEIAGSTNAEVAGLALSPDSALLAWSQPRRPGRGASQIRLARLADGTVTDVTPPRFDDTSPAFTLDGKYLAFLSNRAFDPVYDAHLLDLGFLPGVRPHLVPLLATTPSPFAPDLDGRPVEPDGPGEVPATGTTDTEPPPAGLDVAGLAERIAPFPVEAGRYDKLRAAKDGVVWLDLPRAGELGETVIGAAEEHPTRLVRYDLAQRRRSVEVGALDDYAVSAGGARLACRIGESPQIRPAGGKPGAGEPDGEVVSVDLDRIRVTVAPSAEWTQMYHEAWRLMRDNFWRADMAGVGWAAMGGRYRPLPDRAGSADDLRDVLWELQGEMGSSHAGVLPPAAGGDPALAQGLLGAGVQWTGDGTWRIARILPGESSVIGARSPLAAPGVAAAPGDLIVAVDGRPVDPDLGPNALLAGKADKPVELTLRPGGADRRAVVVPLASEHAVRYYDLVARQRSAVREASGGRLGYLHIPDMMAAGWAEFHRDLNHRGKRHFISECLFGSEPLARWAFSDVMASIAGTLLGPEAYLFVDQYVVKAGTADGEAGMTFSWHQDSACADYPHPAYLTCWCALDDITEDNGTVHLLPYSLAGTAGLVRHVRDEQTHDLVADVRGQAGVPAIVPAGSIVCFSSYLLHSSGANRTGRMRRVYLLQYSPSPILARDGGTLARHAVPFLHTGRNVADPAAPADVPVAG